MKLQNEKIVLNTSNLHVGGGVQVAASVLYELSLEKDLPSNLAVVASSEVHHALVDCGTNFNYFPSYTIFDTHGFTGLWSTFPLSLHKNDVVLTIFGPHYKLQPRYKNIVGFAQAWITHADKTIYRRLSFFSRLQLKIKFFIQAFFFKQADKLVVELEHVKSGLIRSGIARAENIHVIPNCVSSLYFDPSVWKKINPSIGGNKKSYKIGYVGRDYPHKNTTILPKVKEVLHTKYGINADFYVTFTDAEWQSKSSCFKKTIRNVGALSPTQCPSFYSMMDAIIFPSLLECFSATPLETLIMGKPLFASDRPFIRDICGDFAYYFDPLDPASVAEVLASNIIKNEDRDGFRDLARAHAKNFSNASIRAKKYLELLMHNAT